MRYLFSKFHFYSKNYHFFEIFVKYVAMHQWYIMKILSFYQHYLKFCLNNLNRYNNRLVFGKYFRFYSIFQQSFPAFWKTIEKRQKWTIYLFLNTTRVWLPLTCHFGDESPPGNTNTPVSWSYLLTLPEV